MGFNLPLKVRNDVSKNRGYKKCISCDCYRLMKFYLLLEPNKCLDCRRGDICKTCRDIEFIKKAEKETQERIRWFLSDEYKLYVSAKRCEYANAYRIRRIKAKPLWADDDKIGFIYYKSQEKSRITGILHHVDHIVPLKGKNVCGLHVHYNLQIITAIENIKKRNNFTN